MDNENHRVCWCGGSPELVGSVHDPKRRGLYVRCKNCGCRSVTESSASRAWYAWDYYDIQEVDENLTLYDIMKQEATE